MLFIRRYCGKYEVIGKKQQNQQSGKGHFAEVGSTAVEGS
jgi:hypothetical protein